jgi:hypothetical protein
MRRTFSKACWHLHEDPSLPMMQLPTLTGNQMVFCLACGTGRLMRMINKEGQRVKAAAEQLSFSQCGHNEQEGPCASCMQALITELIGQKAYMPTPKKETAA